MPLVANHFWYYAGWADKLEYAFPGRVAQPLGVAAQVIPWNFPLLMLAWKIAPALAAGQHGRPQAGLDHAARPRSSSPRSASRPTCRAGVVNIVPGPSDIGMHLVSHPGRRQGRVHRLDRRRQAHPQGDRRARDKALTLELGGKAANIVFEDAALDQAVEGIVNGIYFNQGEVCCAGLAPARPGVDRRAR